jgi:hypothetical protein
MVRKKASIDYHYRVVSTLLRIQEASASEPAVVILGFLGLSPSLKAQGAIDILSNFSFRNNLIV